MISQVGIVYIYSGLENSKNYYLSCCAHLKFEIVNKEVIGLFTRPALISTRKDKRTSGFFHPCYFQVSQTSSSISEEVILPISQKDDIPVNTGRYVFWIMTGIFIALAVTSFIVSLLPKSADAEKDKMFYIKIIRGEQLPLRSSNDVTSTTTAPQPLEPESCIYNLSQKMAPLNNRSYDCDDKEGHQLVNKTCLMVNGVCTSCPDLFPLMGKFYIGNQLKKTSLSCCLKLKVCQEVDWCNGGEMNCPTAYGIPVCFMCPRGYFGDRCQEALPPARVKCTQIDREKLYIPSETPDCLQSWLQNNNRNCVLHGKNKSEFLCETKQVTEEELQYCRV